MEKKGQWGLDMFPSNVFSFNFHFGKRWCLQHYSRYPKVRSAFTACCCVGNE